MTCVHGVWEAACAICKPIQTPHDQAWRNFTYTFKPGVRKEIHSQRQFNRECQVNGLRPVVKDDLLKRGMPYHPDPLETGLPKETVREVIRSVRESATPDAINRHWTQQQVSRRQEGSALRLARTRHY